MDSMIVQVEINKKEVFLKLNHCSLGELRDKVKAHLSITENVTIIFKKINNTVIPDELLTDILEQYRQCFCFIIKAEIGALERSFEEYPTRKDIEEILDEYRISHLLNNTTKPIHETDKRILAEAVLKHLLQNYGRRLTYGEASLFNKKLKELFPLLTDFYDSSEKKGIFYHKVKNAKAKFKTEQEPKNVSVTSQTIKMSEVVKNTDAISECINFFKQCKITVANTEHIIKKLQETAEIRKFILQDKSVDQYDIFSLYFLDVKYVLYDFEILFKQINAKALQNFWEYYEEKVHSLRNSDFDFNVLQYPDEVTNFIALLYNIQEGISVQKIITSARALVTIVQHTAAISVFKATQFPYVILQEDVLLGNNYYIRVYDRIINIPKKTSFVDVMDIFFKIHKVLNIDYSPNFKKFMQFIGLCIFNYEESVTSKDKKVFEKILNNIIST